MARFLVLDWDHQELRLVYATIKRGAVQLHRAVAHHEAGSPNPTEAEALGKTLRERMKSLGAPAAPVLACVGRDRVIVKEIRFPAVPAAEEPALVRFQVMKELNEPADQVVIDYFIAEESPGGERRALAVILRRELLAGYQTLCRAAGLKLEAVCPRAFGVAAFPREAGEQGAVAILTLGGVGAELCVVHGKRLLLARSLSSGPGLEGEVKRSLLAYAGQAREAVTAIYVADGADADALRQRLENSTRLPTRALDPLTGVQQAELPPGSGGAFTGAVGLLHAWTRNAGVLPINFAAPKQSREPGEGNRRRLIAGAVAAVLLLGAGAAWCYAQIASRDAQLAGYFEEKASLDLQLANLEEESKKLKAADEWARSGIVWLDELYDLTERFPDPNSLRLVQLTADPLARGPKDPHVARLTLKGMGTSDYQALDGFMGRLVEDGHYRVEPKVLARNSGFDRLRFPQQFTTRMDLERQGPEKYTVHLPQGDSDDEPRRPGGRRGRRRDAEGGVGGFGGELP